MAKFLSTMKGSSREISRRRKFFLVLVSGGIALLLLFFLPRTLSMVASVFMTPLVTIETYFLESHSAIPTYLRDRQTLLEERYVLEQQLAEAIPSDERIALLQADNDLLRSVLGSEGRARIGAGVVGRPTALPYDVFIIDKGSDDGIRLHAPVFLGDDRAIGFVAEVFSGSAIVTLATTPGFETTVYIYGPNIYTTAVGVGGGSLRVNVPQGIELNVGDVVVIPSFDAGVYGSVAVVDSVPSRPEQYGYVSMEVPLASVRYVSVGTTPLTALSFDEAKHIVERVRADFLSVPVPSGVLVDVATTSSTEATTTEDVIDN